MTIGGTEIPENVWILFEQAVDQILDKSNLTQEKEPSWGPLFDVFIYGYNAGRKISVRRVERPAFVFEENEGNGNYD